MEDKKLSIEEKEKYINDYFNSIPSEARDFFMTHLNEFINMSCSVIDTLSSYEKDFSSTTEIVENNQKLDFNTKVKIVEDFYESIGINIDINKMINDGDIYLYNSDDTITSPDKDVYNINSVSGMEPYDIVYLTNTGKAIEASIWVHEIAHYLENQTSKDDIGSIVLSDTVAVSTELNFIEFAREKYNMDFSDILRLRIHFSMFSAERSIDWCKYLYAYIINGMYNENGYNKAFKGENKYEDSLGYFEKLNDKMSIVKGIGYTMAMFLAPYIAYQFRNDKEFKKEFKNIYSTKTLDELLSLCNINLNNVSAKSFSVFLDLYVGRALKKSIKKTA